MNIVMLLLTGGIVGWAAYAFLGFNAQRGMFVSIVIGGLGGIVGGRIIAPMFTAAAAAPGDFSLSALVFAAAIAAAFLAAGNLAHDRWGV